MKDVTVQSWRAGYYLMLRYRAQQYIKSSLRMISCSHCKLRRRETKCVGLRHKHVARETLKTEEGALQQHWQFSSFREEDG